MMRKGCWLVSLNFPPRYGKYGYRRITVLKFTAQAVRRWLDTLEVNTLFIERASSWESEDIQELTFSFLGHMSNSEQGKIIVKVFYFLSQGQKIFSRMELQRWI